ncbi:MAG: hypothetical protein JWQ39_610 [Glaciihabitans sp.]|nr:hypothetical protein [Glaciihabitans sp.]
MSDSTEKYAVLEGLDLGGGWTLGAIRPDAKESGSTGGHFSVQFAASRADGAKAFCKVLDLVTAGKQPNAGINLQIAVTAFNFEAQLIELCGSLSARRVVFAIKSGELRDERVPLELVMFILFEDADDDARTYLDKGLADDLFLRLRSLRHVALGVRELHNMRIAHQDLKPSNVLVFGSAATLPESKIADLGRASLDGTVAVHDELPFAGPAGYSPPELLYGQVAADFYQRRQACDLYQLGCLVAFMLADMSINLELTSRLTEDQQWRKWGDSYSAIYPLIRTKMDEVFEELWTRLDPAIADGVVEVVRDLCDPDPERRGKQVQGRSPSPSVILSKLITRLDVLEKRARIAGAKVA